MPDLLLELLSEEIPARMQARAAEDLKKLVTDALVESGLTYEGAKAFATPRRLALTVQGLPGRAPDRKEERKGPRVGAPDGAIQGFLKAAGLKDISQAKVQNDPKGDFYIAVTEKAGRAAEEIIAAIMPKIVREFPWPKSMRWGEGTLRWVRPLQSILCTFGTSNEEPEIVRFEIDGIKSGNTTVGHRFLAPDVITVRRFDDYVPALEKAKVVLDPARRREIILNDARDLALAQGLELVEDDALLDEVSGLVEWPVVLMGSFDESFLDVPDEVIRTTIRANQKCFVLRDPRASRRGFAAPQHEDRAKPYPEEARSAVSKDGAGTLANKFLLVSNLDASDGGKAIIAGNQRVVRARLSDAKFFWETDKRISLDERAKKLEQIVFHEKLGTVCERVERIAKLARELAPLVGADPAKAERAARLAKADLVTETVGEFPEVQGLAGRYLAALQGEDAEVAEAIGDHYKPQGQGDRVPSAPVAIAVALAEKLDTLVGFWSIDEKPTGSKDPYALRRAALGVIRIVLDNGLRLPLSDRATPDLIAFFADRLKVQLRDQGARHDLVDAVFSQEAGSAGGATGKAKASNQDDLVLIVRRVEALAAFLGSDDGKNLLAGYKRAANILRIEEKKDGEGAFNGAPDTGLVREVEESDLIVALERAETAALDAVHDEDFAAAMQALSELRGPVDAFFDKVTVNADEPKLRANRLKLLAKLRTATRTVADFSKIEG